jgi:hypothetical protein
MALYSLHRSGGFQATAAFAQLAKTLAADPSLVKKVGVVYRFDLTADGKNKSWCVSTWQNLFSFVNRAYFPFWIS